MERLLVSWALSPSTFVEKQQLFAAVYPSGSVSGSATQYGADMPSSQQLVEVLFDAGNTIKLFVRTIGDNGSQADSPVVTFDVNNLETVSPAGSLSVQWIEHVS